MEYEEILPHIGEFGPFQWKVYMLLCVFSLVTPFHLFSQIFFVKPVQHWCYDHTVDSLNCSIFNITEEDECLDVKRSISVPRSSDFTFEKCLKYQLDVTSGPVIGSNTTNVIPCDEGWSYGPSAYHGYSIISDGPVVFIPVVALMTLGHNFRPWESLFETACWRLGVVGSDRPQFDLVCERKSFSHLALSLFFASVMLGVIFFGWLSDRIGRYYTILIMSGFLLIFGVALCFAQSFTSYVILRALMGPCAIGLFTIPFVLGSELVSSPNRIWTGFIIQFFFALGYSLLAFIAKFVQNWRHLQLVITLPTLFIFAGIPFVVESPRWLLARGKTKEALNVIRKIAAGNKKEVPDFSLDDSPTKKDVVRDETCTLTGMLKDPVMLTRTLTLMISWFIVNIAYMVVNYSAGDFGVDLFIGSFILAAVEFPANIAAMVLLKYMGRRWSQSLMFVTCGSCCLISRLAAPGFWQMAIMVVAKFAISASFNSIFVYTAEIYPTPIRSVSISVCSMFARVGGTIFPFILLLVDVWEHLPLVIAGALSIVSGVCILSLPETKHLPLPETMEEARNIGKKRTPLSTKEEAI